MNMSYNEMRASTGHGAGVRGRREDDILAPRASCLDLQNVYPILVIKACLPPPCKSPTSSAPSPKAENACAARFRVADVGCKEGTNHNINVSIVTSRERWERKVKTATTQYRRSK